MSQLLAQAAGQGQSILQLLAPMGIVVLIFYFIALRPMQKKQKEHQAFLSALKKGDKVVTNGGFYGEVARVEGDLVTLKLADNIKVRIAKQGIAGPEGAPIEKGDGP